MMDEDMPEDLQQRLSWNNPWVLTWRGALKQMDAYPWQFLYPLEVHPDFRKRVKAALKIRQKHGEIQWDDWGRVLSDFPKK